MKIKPVSKNVFYVETFWIIKKKNVKLKQELHEIVASKNLGPKGIFAAINLFISKSVNKYSELSRNRHH